MLFSTGYSDSNHSGCFELVSRNINSQYLLQGRPDGTLYWNGNDLASAAIVAKSLGYIGYIKYASGLILQWGSVANIAAKVTGHIIFPISFSTSYEILYTTVLGSSGETTVFPIVKSIGGSLRSDNFICSEAVDYVTWFAIGN